MKQYFVDTRAIEKNLALIRQKAGSARIIAVVKGNGYGLGTEQMAKFCRQAGVDAFAVTEAEDAVLLRSTGTPEEMLLMLRPTVDKEELHRLLRVGAVCTISSQQDALALSAAARELGVRAAAHVKLDTGMGRYGFLPAELDKILSCYEDLDSVDVTGIYTHFHSAFCNKQKTLAQLQTLRDVTDQLTASGVEPGMVHCANSSALFRLPETAMDAVRVGSAILGRLVFRTKLERVGVCYASVEEIRWLPKGATTGYGAAWKARKPTRIAVLPIGWYNGFGIVSGPDVFRRRDSLRRMLSALRQCIFPPCLSVQIGEKKCRVLGHVGMCHTTVEAADPNIREGDLALLEINPTKVRGLELVFG